MSGSRSVLLVGSIPLNTAQDVFLKVADRVGTLVHRIPDGETGARLNWIVWQGTGSLKSRGSNCKASAKCQARIKPALNLARSQRLGQAILHLGR